jgi:hypothetical protein
MVARTPPGRRAEVGRRRLRLLLSTGSALIEQRDGARRPDPRAGADSHRLRACAMTRCSAGCSAARPSGLWQAGSSRFGCGSTEPKVSGSNPAGRARFPLGCWDPTILTGRLIEGQALAHAVSCGGAWPSLIFLATFLATSSGGRGRAQSSRTRRSGRPCRRSRRAGLRRCCWRGAGPSRARPR